MKERILSAFLKLSKTRGFYRVTMDELATEAGVSKRTLYRYFRSKEEMIEAVLEELMANVESLIEEFVASHHKPDEIVANMLRILHRISQTLFHPLVLGDLQKHYPHYWKKIDQFRVKNVENIVQAKLFLDEKNKGLIRNLDPRIVTAAITASIRAVANPDFIITNGLTAEDTLTQLMEFFLYGLLKKESSPG
ncbi:MAG: TetR/AcrR family transcriptional regulator [Firmicutes bacterium]|nr:TetR/AcrR family transcriptional regulator [Bacillota bacterium]